MLLVMISVVNKHIIFQQAPGTYRMSIAAADPAVPIDMRFSGRMVLSQKAVSRFLNVPAGIGTTKEGEIAIVSRINANVKTAFGGVIDRTGVWTSIIKPGTLSQVETGLQYVGFSVTPALRLRYVESSLSKANQATTVVSFGSEEQRDRAREEFEKRSRGAVVSEA